MKFKCPLTLTSTNLSHTSRHDDTYNFILSSTEHIGGSSHDVTNKNCLSEQMMNGDLRLLLFIPSANVMNIDM